jgi:hypothetical protein
MPDYTAPGAVRRLPGEKFADFAARQRASQLAAKPKPKRRRIAAPHVESYEDRLDDLGESPDR